MLYAIVAVALLFDFTNGFHDAANVVASPIATRSVSPRTAVVAAALLNFLGAFLSLKVAATIGKGIIDSGAVTADTVLAGLVGAVAWNVFTWLRGIPSSSSHALVGGVAGAALTAAGSDAVNWDGLVDKVLIPAVLSPLAGFALAAVLTLLLSGRVGRALDRRPRPMRGLQLVSAGFVALTHGMNDAQKTMGVITLALVADGRLESFSVPDWVIVASAATMAAGTLTGGSRIIRTLGRDLTGLDLRAGTAAQTATAIVLYVAGRSGYPVSTTHAVTGAVLGSGVRCRWCDTRWVLAGRIVLAWLLTMPAAAVVGAAAGGLVLVRFGWVVLLAAAVAALVVIWRQRRQLIGGWSSEVESELGPIEVAALPIRADAGEAAALPSGR